MRWGGVGMSTFLQPRSFAQDVDATDVDATLTWGGVGWPETACKPPRPTLYVAADDDEDDVDI